MSDDGFTATVRYYANFPRVTHLIRVGDKTIGRVYDNGAMEIDDPPPAHQDSARPMSGETPS